MELVFLLFLVGAGVAVKSAWDNAGTERRKGGNAKVKAAKKAAGGDLSDKKARSIQRRHATGWWLREVGGGFPVARTGWHAGWLAHSTEARHQRHIREEARTGDLEAKAAYLPQIRDHKKRQQELRDEILRNTDPGGGRKAVREAADGVVLHPDFPVHSEPLAPTGTDGPAPTRRVDGQPETDADRRFFDARESGYRGPLDQDGHPVMSRTDGDGNPLPMFEGGTGTGTPDDHWPTGVPHRRKGDDVADLPKGLMTFRDEADLAEFAKRHGRTIESVRQQAADDGVRLFDSPATATEGSTMTSNIFNDVASEEDHANPYAGDGEFSTRPAGGFSGGGGSSGDTTFSGVIAAAKGVASASEGDLATMGARRKMLEQMADEMQGKEVDPASLSQMMDLIEGYQRAEQAMKGVQDSAAALPQGLQQRHGGLDEAHREAPVRAAQRGFYAEGN